MYNQDNNRLAAVEAILADFFLGMQEFRKAQAEVAKSQAEAAKSLAAVAKSQAETDRQMKEYQAAADKRQAAADKRRAAVDLEIKKMSASIKQVSQQMGGMANSNGDMAQDYFFNSLYLRKTLFGQEFDEVKTEKRKIKKTGVEVQYDIILVNGKSVCIVEVKYKADTDDVRKMLSIKDKFRQNYPEHADKQLYLALASMSFDDYVENECKKLGIAIIKQVGDTIEIYDEHLKVF